MNILMLCTKYSLDDDSPYLCDELADELCRKGHSVSAMVMDWGNTNAKRKSNRIERQGRPSIFFAPTVHIAWLPASMSRLARWLFSPFLACKLSRRLTSDIQPDLVIAFSPLMAMSLPVWIATRKHRAKHFLVQWDFFPDAQVQIGLMKDGMLARILKALETYLIRRFTIVGCMSPKNIEYLESNYRLYKTTRTVMLPIWTSAPIFSRLPRDLVRGRYSLPLDARIFVFGGQLTQGRGVEDIISVSRKLRHGEDKILFLIIGEGRLKDVIEQEIRNGNKFLRLLAGISRKSYLELISACDVGIVATLRDVTVPTFPSKTLDYLLAGLPILASVEEATDYGSIVEESGLGVSVHAGDLSEFLKVVRAFSDGEYQFLNSEEFKIIDFSVSNASDIITASCEAQMTDEIR